MPKWELRVFSHRSYQESADGNSVDWIHVKGEGVALAAMFSEESRTLIISLDEKVIRIWNMQPKGDAPVSVTFRQDTLLLAKKLKGNVYQNMLKFGGHFHCLDCFNSLKSCVSSKTTLINQNLSKNIPKIAVLDVLENEPDRTSPSLLASTQSQSKNSSGVHLNLTESSCSIQNTQDDKVDKVINKISHLNKTNSCELIAENNMISKKPSISLNSTSKRIKVKEQHKLFKETTNCSGTNFLPQSKSTKLINPLPSVSILPTSNQPKTAFCQPQSTSNSTTFQYNSKAPNNENNMSQNFKSNEQKRSRKSKVLTELKLKNIVKDILTNGSNSSFDLALSEGTLSGLSDEALKTLVAQCLNDPNLPQLVRRIHRIISNF